MVTTLLFMIEIGSDIYDTCNGIVRMEQSSFIYINLEKRWGVTETENLDIILIREDIKISISFV